MSPAAASPIFRLVLFIVCLALFGSIIGGAHYYLVDLPEQKTLSGSPPANWNLQDICNSCKDQCKWGPEDKYWECMERCTLACV